MWHTQTHTHMQNKFYTYSDRFCCTLSVSTVTPGGGSLIRDISSLCKRRCKQTKREREEGNQPQFHSNTSYLIWPEVQLTNQFRMHFSLLFFLLYFPTYIACFVDFSMQSLLLTYITLFTLSIYFFLSPTHFLFSLQTSICIGYMVYGIRQGQTLYRLDKIARAMLC